ncbi:hypothetical protein FKP32DRAFT_1756598 [Trametes sanguinea]|nr:hypothetical protein FKP32DRAFT_1756598 [Trametes sanguinea]
MQFSIRISSPAEFSTLSPPRSTSPSLSASFLFPLYFVLKPYPHCSTPWETRPMLTMATATIREGTASLSRQSLRAPMLMTFSLLLIKLLSLRRSLNWIVLLGRKKSRNTRIPTLRFTIAVPSLAPQARLASDPFALDSVFSAVNPSCTMTPSTPFGAVERLQTCRTIHPMQS